MVAQTPTRSSAARVDLMPSWRHVACNTPYSPTYLPTYPSAHLPAYLRAAFHAGAKLAQGLEVRSGEHVVIKKRFSGFLATHLDLMLRLVMCWWCFWR